MTESRTCYRWGLLVDGKTPVSDNPAEYRCAFFGKWGCNRLRCAGCNALVLVGAPGVMPRYSKGQYALALSQIEQLHTSEDWSSLPFIEQQPGGFGRLYVCKCQCSEQFTVDYVSGHDNYAPDDENDPRRPWACDGHPLPTLPILLGESRLIVEDESDAGRLVEALLAGAQVRPLGTEYEGPALALSWLYAFLLGLPIAERIARTIGRKLEEQRNSDELVDIVATFYTRFPRAAGVAHVFAAIEHDFNDRSNDGQVNRQLSLWRVLEARLAERQQSGDELDNRSWHLFQRLIISRNLHRLFEERIILMFERGSGRFNPEELRWLSDNSPAIELAGPGRWPALLGLIASSAMTELIDGYLVVIAGLALVKAQCTTAEQLRDWSREWNATHSNRDNAWSVVLDTALADLAKRN